MLALTLSPDGRQRCDGLATRRRTSRPVGVALVIVLGFVVLLTVIVAAYLSKTESAVRNSVASSALVQSEILAKSTVETLVGDLRDEMLAGAANDPLQPNGSSINGMQVSPDGRWAAVPARVIAPGVDTANVNLIKQSLYKQPAYPSSDLATSPATTPLGRPLYWAKSLGGATTGKVRASSVSTAAASQDGRIISALRWSTSGLLASDLKDNQLPNWIYINRRGLQDDGTIMDGTGGLADAANPVSNNESYVIGRVAYNIYDTGGLLNANAIGYPATPPSVPAYAVRKGSPAWADAHYLGMSSGGPGMTDAEISDLVNWRNGVSQTNSTFPNGFPDFVNNWAEANGFLVPFTNGSKTDGTFFGRQDLIHYWLRKNNVSNYGQLAQLTGSQQYERLKLSELTTFSAFTTTPSFYTANLRTTFPQRPAILPSASGGNFSGDSPGGSAKYRPLYNPFVPDILVPGTGFVRYRKAVGAATVNGAFTRQVAATKGDPLVNSRFPLSRLAILTQTAVTTSDNDDIVKFFGLRRSSIDTPWVYSHGDPTLIEPLSTVATLNREPDFFELLQAAVDAGSVGKTFPRGGSGPGNAAINLRDQQPSYNIIQIGANIISQADPTGYPTAIQFFDGNHFFYGVKSLPYFTRYRAPLVQVSAVPGSYQYRVFLQPEVWNPHEVVAADGTSVLPPAGPTHFRIVAKTAFGFQGYCQPYGELPVQFGGGDLQEATSAIGFSTQFNNYSEPTPLGLTGGGDVLKTGAYDAGANGTSGTLLGISSGLLSLAAPLPTGSGWYMMANDGLTFTLQYQSAAGNWVAYSKREFLSAQAASGSDPASANPYVPNMWTIAQYQLAGRWTGWDPRTDRFNFPGAMNRRDDDPVGYPFYNYSGNAVAPQAAGPYGFGTLRPSTLNGYGPWVVDRALAATYGWTVVNGDPFMAEGSIAMGTITQNNQQLGNTTWYNDPDGVDRGGDGFYWSRGVNGLPLANNNTPSRPYVLNRAFRSVGELGYTFRGVPYRSLDFFTKNSGDADLLDTFCIDEQPDNGVVSGHISLNTRQPDVLNAILNNTLTTEPSPGTGDLTGQTAAAISQDMQTLLTNTGTDASLISAINAVNGPMINRSEIVTRLMPMLEQTTSQFYGATGGANAVIKRRAEAVVRALADSVETNTWNVMVDMVVQSGRFPTSGARTAGAFIVNSERRYWAHLAIDRTTGKVIASYLEPVYE